MDEECKSLSRVIIMDYCSTFQSNLAASLRASSSIWASEASLARTRELVSLAQIGELARSLRSRVTKAVNFPVANPDLQIRGWGRVAVIQTLRKRRAADHQKISFDPSGLSLD